MCVQSGVRFCLGLVLGLGLGLVARGTTRGREEPRAIIGASLTTREPKERRAAAGRVRDARPAAKPPHHRRRDRGARGPSRLRLRRARRPRARRPRAPTSSPPAGSLDPAEPATPHMGWGPYIAMRRCEGGFKEFFDEHARVFDSSEEHKLECVM